jgi:hypothetical protein
MLTWQIYVYLSAWVALATIGMIVQFKCHKGGEKKHDITLHLKINK